MSVKTKIKAGRPATGDGH